MPPDEEGWTLYATYTTVHAAAEGLVTADNGFTYWVAIEDGQITVWCKERT